MARDDVSNQHAFQRTVIFCWRSWLHHRLLGRASRLRGSTTTQRRQRIAGLCACWGGASTHTRSAGAFLTFLACSGSVAQCAATATHGLGRQAQCRVKVLLSERRLTWVATSTSTTAWLTNSTSREPCQVVSVHTMVRFQLLNGVLWLDLYNALQQPHVLSSNAVSFLLTRAVVQ